MPACRGTTTSAIWKSSTPPRLSNTTGACVGVGWFGKALGMFIERRQQLGEDGQPVNTQLFTVSITG
jgi:hypothetical protein